MTPPTEPPPEQFDSGDAAVDAALTDLAAQDPSAAEYAKTGFSGLTWGEGLSMVTLRGLQEYLWYVLPEKYWGPVEEHHAIARGLGALFDELGLHGYAAVCGSPVTTAVLDAYATGGRSAGITAYRKALTNGGVEPPDIPGLLTWGGVLGVDEHAAFWALAEHLEDAITGGQLTPGRRSWRDIGTGIAEAFLTVPRIDLGGDSHLDRIHAERRTRWADSRGPGRGRLTNAVLPLLMKAAVVPDDADDHLAQIRWFLQHCDGDGAALTVNHTLSRALLTEACHRFDWLILGKQAPPEHQLPEAFHLRGIVEQLGGTRRRGRRLLLTANGRELLRADTPTLWSAVTATLIPTDPAEAAAAEVLLMQLLTADPPSYGSPIVAEALTGEGWGTDGGPVTADSAGWLTGRLFGRLDFLRLTERAGLTHRAPLTAAGRAGAITALRHRAHAPRDRP